MGGSSKSSSSSDQTTNTTNIDRRQVVGENGIGLSSDSSTINVTTMDSGIVKAAIDAVKAGDATNGDGFAKLLDLADKMFTGAGDIIGKAQDTTLSQIAQLNQARNDQNGKIDQKTLIIVGGIALGALAVTRKK